VMSREELEAAECRASEYADCPPESCGYAMLRIDASGNGRAERYVITIQDA